MNQAIVDTRTFKKAVGPILVGTDDATKAAARAAREQRNGRFVFVCSWCVLEGSELHSALKVLVNLSHGTCTPCMKKAMQETAEDAEIRGVRPSAVSAVKGGAL